jgi:hypothetical protein
MRWGRRRGDTTSQPANTASLTGDLVQRRPALAPPSPAPASGAADHATMDHDLSAPSNVVPPDFTAPDLSAPEFVGVPDEPLPPTEIIDPLLRLGLSIVLGLGVTYGHIRSVVDGNTSLAMASWRFGIMTALAWGGLWFVWTVWLSYRSRLDAVDIAARTQATERYWVRVEAEYADALRVEAQEREEMRLEAEHIEAHRVEAERLEAERVAIEELAVREREAQRRREASGSFNVRGRGLRADQQRLAVERQSAVALALDAQRSDGVSDALAADEARRVEAMLRADSDARVPILREPGLYSTTALAAERSVEPFVDLAATDNDEVQQWMRTDEMQAAS